VPPTPTSSALLTEAFGQLQEAIAKEWQRFLAQAGVTPEGLRAASLMGDIATHAGAMLAIKTESVGPAVHASPAVVVLSDQLIDAVWAFAMQGGYNGDTTIKLHLLPATSDTDSVIGTIVLPQQTTPKIQRVALSGADLTTRVAPRGSWMWLEVSAAPSATLPPSPPPDVTARAQLVTVAVTWDAPANPRIR
jgi:hypothetical protein